MFDRPNRFRACFDFPARREIVVRSAFIAQGSIGNQQMPDGNLLVEHAGTVIDDYDVTERHEPLADVDRVRLAKIECEKALAGIPVGEPRRELRLRTELGHTRRNVQSGHVRPLA